MEEKKAEVKEIKKFDADLTIYSIVNSTSTIILSIFWVFFKIYGFMSGKKYEETWKEFITDFRENGSKFKTKKVEELKKE